MDEKADKKIVVKIVCVLLSFSLWFYISNAENPNRTSVIKDVPVEVLNEDALKSLGLTLTPNQEFAIDLSVEGPAKEIYSSKKEDFKLAVDLSDYALKTGDNNVPVKLVDYPSGINIKSGSVLSIKIKIEELVEKEVEVKSNVNVSYKEGFSKDSMEIDPKTIIVSGAKGLVDKVDHAELNGKISDVSSDFEEEFDIWAVDNTGAKITDVTLSKDKGKLKVNVIQGKEVDVKVKYKGALQSGINISKEELSSSKISILGESNVINNISYIETEELDLSSVTKSGEYAVKLKVPDGITIANSIESVVVKLTLDGDITKEIKNVPVSFSGLDESKFAIEGSNSVNITITANINNVSNISANDIEVVASLSDINEAGNYTVKWTATSKNNNVNIINKEGNIDIILKAK